MNPMIVPTISGLQHREGTQKDPGSYSKLRRQSSEMRKANTIKICKKDCQRRGSYAEDEL